MERSYNKAANAIKKIITAITSVTILMILSTFAVFAANDTVTINSTVDGKSVSGITWKAYKIADYNAHGKIVLEDPFDKYGFELSADLTEEEIGDIAVSMANSAETDGLTAAQSAESDNDGDVSLSGLRGVYLVTGSNAVVGSKVYTVTPMIIEVTGHEDVNVNAKLVFNNENYTVEKLWKGDKVSSHSAIEIEIYKDGSLVETVTLNEANNWKYAWSSDEEGAKYSVKEKVVPENYQVSYRAEGSDLVVVNTYEEPETPTEETTEETTFEETTDEDDTEEESESKKRKPSKDKETEEETTNPSDEESGGRLPVTGLLWWPVLVLALGGAICVVVGRKIKREE